jgi:hypothetical protein
MNKRAGLGLAVAGVVLCALAAQAQANAAFGPELSGAEPSRDGQSREGKQRPLPDRLPDKPSVPPAFTIPIEPIGFTAPGPIYLGARNSMASLDFLDENRLLFTFRVPGLMRREAGASAGSDERQIRAVVVVLPEGKVESEALWTVHDRVRYLWMLKDAHFLLRDRDGLQEGDAKLELKPLLQFPGPLLWVELDPTQHFMVTNSREPALAATGDLADGQKTGQPSLGRSDQVKPDRQADLAKTDAGKTDAGKTDLVLRILHLESGRVMLVSRVPSTVHLPINSDGYLDSLRGNGQQWLLNLNYFSGGSRVLGRVDSACSPAFDFVSQREVLVTGCNGSGGRKLVAMDTSGHRLWEDSTSASAIWPLVVMGPDGSRLAQETLAVNHAVNASAPVDREDVKGQLVRVFNAADGKVALEAPASPALDAGGNVAISPSGRRVAVLNAGAIQVFDLPAPPPLADTAGNQTAH